jgi:hypothetical protein
MFRTRSLRSSRWRTSGRERVEMSSGTVKDGRWRRDGGMVVVQAGAKAMDWAVMLVGSSW